MTRLLLTPSDPGPAAHPAKNKPTGPGLPNQSHGYTERNTMVGKLRARISPRARRFAQIVVGDRVVYTPHALNALIDTTVKREIAGCLNERAQWHRRVADLTSLPDCSLDDWKRAAWHILEARRLEKMAAAELARIAGGEDR
ncbi:hypothetical protein [Amycolatopsis sp. 195334CR]|uniref:hypothetical protein n=1 Tax=Amycolatopsis sp. 195334CR TaxID=2814588 RepID=UPI001A8C54A6|nr:hypothetical protein [Amycolatopsis sp. 195334CR]MBN6036233.1 hypothetical protein [Amycolatopsis sp. 195334CR]